MIEASEFAEGLTKIGIAVRQPADPATLAVYHDVLGRVVEAPEWRAFVAWSLAGSKWRWFPKVAEIMDALREFRGHKPIASEATRAYERVLGSGTYTAEGGTTWIYRNIKQACGDAAAEAFLAAGGHSAFSVTYDEAKRRERFVAAYAEAVRDDSSTALLEPAHEPRQLHE